MRACVVPCTDSRALVVMQDAGWELKVDGQVKELYLSVLRRLDTGAAAQTEWLSSAKSSLSGSVQQPCSSCKTSSEKVCLARPIHKFPVTMVPVSKATKHLWQASVDCSARSLVHPMGEHHPWQQG